MYPQAAPFLQTQMEQILAHHEQLDAFEVRPYIHLCFLPENMGTFNLIKCGSTIKVIHNRDRYVTCDENPNITFEILQTGDWIVRDMVNSHFHDEDGSKNTVEFWDTLIRFDRLNDAVVYEVPSKNVKSRQSAALMAG